MVEQMAENHCVASSILALGIFGVWPSGLRRLLWEQKIGGSNPLTPTILVVWAWAPWLNNQSPHDRAFKERAKIDGTIDKYTIELIYDLFYFQIEVGR